MYGAGFLWLRPRSGRRSTKNVSGDQIARANSPLIFFLNYKIRARDPKRAGAPAEGWGSELRAARILFREAGLHLLVVLR